MGVICKYKFDSSIYADLIPEFNSEFTGYTVNDEVEGNIITRTIESDSLPTLMRFGRAWVEGEAVANNRTDSLLEVSDMNTSGLISANSMFRYCTNLTSISCEWDTSNVTAMYDMFSACSNLTSLDVSNWNTNKVTNMGNIFRECKKLTSLDVSNFNTSNVTNMYCMFYNCKSLTSLDVSNFNTSNATNMSNMFNNCNNLTSLDVSNWNTNNVTNMGSMFCNCKNLISLDVSNFNTSNVDNMHGMFQNCTNLTSLDVSNFNTSKVTDMGYMFQLCSKLTTLDVSNFDTSKVTDTTSMFTNTNSLEVMTMFNCDIDTINTIGNLTSATIYVDESLDQSQYTGTASLKVYKEEKLEIKLNSPLLMGDTIEVVDDKICHVHRWDKVVLDGSEDDYSIWGSKPAENHSVFILKYTREKICKGIYTTIVGADNHHYLGVYICDNFVKGDVGIDGYHMTFYNNFHFSLPTNQLNENTVEGFKQWLSKNPTTLVYPLATPYYEDITPLQSSIVLKTFLESYMTIDTNLPIETKLSYRTNVPSISTLSTRATELTESDNVIHNLMNIIDDEVDE